MLRRVLQVSGATLLGTIALVGCADPSTGPSAPAPVRAVEGVRSVVADACEVITFDQFGHGDAITSVSLPTIGLTLGIATVSYDPNGGVVSARAFETDGLDDNPAGPGSVVVEDDDLQFRGEDNSFGGEADGGGECAGCAGLGRLLVIPDYRAYVPWGDHIFGGEITFSGNFSGGDYYISSFTAVDQEAGTLGIRLLVDGTQVAESGTLGNGSVQTVTVGTTHDINNNFMFRLGTTDPSDFVTGSGAIDGIRVCRRAQVLGNEGCTPGYWKQQQHADSWILTGYSPSQTLESVFDVPNSYNLDNETLLEALSFSGGPTTADKAAMLLRHAVAALLNAESTGVDYGMAASTIISQVNAALASNNAGTIQTLATTLDNLNNAGCPPN